MARAFVLSKGLTSAGTWPNPKQSEYNVIKSKIIKIFRSCFGDLGKEARNTDEMFLALHSLSTTHNMIAAERLSLFCRLLAKGTDLVWWTLAAAKTTKTSRGPRSWLQAITTDLDWVVSRFAAFETLRGKSFQETCQIISEDPSKFKRMFRKCLLNDAQDPYFEIDGEGTYKKVCNDPYIQNEYCCIECGRSFIDARALASHRSKVHDERSMAAKWCRSTTCWTCGVQFHSWPRIYQHLNRKRTNRCLETIISLDNPLSNVESAIIRQQCVEQARAAKALGVRAHFAGEACRRMCGPVLKGRI